MKKLNIRENCNIDKNNCKEDNYCLKWEYNKTLQRVLKADRLMEKVGEKFFQNKKWVEEYFNLCKVLSNFIKEYKNATGLELTEKEIEEGFDILDFYEIEEEKKKARFREKYNKEMLEQCM